MKKIFILLVILILILLALIIYQKSKVTDEEGFKITFQNREIFLTYSKIHSNEKISFTTGRGDRFNGFDFAEILKILKIPTDIRTEYIFHSKDGGTLNLTKEKNETYYFVFQEDATGQFIRLVIPTDEFSQRWIKYLVAIEIE